MTPLNRIAIALLVALVAVPNTAVAQGQPATPGVHQRPQSTPQPTPDAPPLAADTTHVPITQIADPATPDMAIGADLMDIDQPLHRLYVSNHISHGVDVFDLSGTTPTYITTVRGIGGAEGIAAAPVINRVFAATPSGALVVIDASEMCSSGPQHDDPSTMPLESDRALNGTNWWNMEPASVSDKGADNQRE